MEMSFKILRELSGLTIHEVAEVCGVSHRTAYRWENGDSKPPLLAIRKLQEIVHITNSHRMSRKTEFTFIDLFAGIGGFRKAFDSIGGECVFTSEWDKNCRITYNDNYENNHPVEGDIREFTGDAESLNRIPRFDVLVAGFPCQPFSLAGVSKKNSLGRTHGFLDETQGTLFFDVARIIQHHQPEAFLLENVKNLKSHDKKKTFQVIKNTLSELGYDTKEEIIDGRNWVPQHRERIFIVGFKRRREFNFDFKKLALTPKEEHPKLSTILHNNLEEDEAPFFIDNNVNEKYTLTPKLWDYLQAYKAKHLAKGNGFGFGLFGENDVARTLSARYHKDGSEILIRQDEKDRPRRLTPRECARLMGFDGPGESDFRITVSDTQAYRQFGNSVVVPAAKAVAGLMKPFILEGIKRRTGENENNNEAQLAPEPQAVFA